MNERKPLIELFLHINSQINLSAIRDAEWVYTKHILDSLELNKLDILTPWKTLLDVGTWGWFPLLPLAMTNPQVQCFGIDTRRKKIDAINTMIEQLSISNAHWVRWRVEEYQWSFDYVVSRATAYIDVLIWWTIHLLKKWWYYVFYKQYTEEEHEMLLKMLSQYKLELIQEHRYRLFDGDIERVLYVIEK